MSATATETAATHIVDFGVLAVPHFPGCTMSVIANDGYADTVTIRTATAHIALSVYAANRQGEIAGYFGNCLGYLGSENVHADRVEWVSNDDVGGTTDDGTHIRFLRTSGAGWLLRGAVRAPHLAATDDVAFTKRLLVASVVRAPRHFIAGTVLELNATPRWLSL